LCARYGFDGWFVLEQEALLGGEPTDQGPVRHVLASVTYLRDVLRSTTASAVPV
jgi:inosose dehydratase